MSGKRPADLPPDQPNPPKLQKNDAGKPVDPMAQILAKKAEIQAMLAARKAGLAPPAPGAAAKPAPTPAPPPPAAGGGAVDPTSIAAMLAAAKARLAARVANLGAAAPAPAATTPSSARPGALVGVKKERNDDMPKGGLNLGIHPSLLEPAASASAAGSSKDKGRTMAPKFTSLKANARNASGSPAPSSFGAAAAAGPSSSAATVNPYLAAAEAAQDEISGPTRKSRDFKFVQKGRYVQLGDQMRADASMEALKARIAASARKAGMDTEFDTLEKLVKREPPPEVEWWDEPLLGSESYDALGEGTSQIENDQGPITYFVQHPVQIQPPWEKRKIEPQALKLTKKEAKKMRKQRRMAELQDKQDRVRMGLIPPDQPKVSMKNLMRVLANDAIADPTQVEAKVRRQVENRRLGHERTNEKRKLTPDARREKVELGKEKEEAKGIFGAVFRVRYLSNPQHKFKVRENAKQNSLTGCCIFNPKFCLVYVEGSAKAVKFYKRVMLVRIDWTESARPLAGDEVSAPAPARTDGESEENMGENRCDLIWEGPLKDKSFDSFRPKNTESERAVREFLGEKNQGYWDIASRFVPDDN